MARATAGRSRVLFPLGLLVTVLGIFVPVRPAQASASYPEELKALLDLYYTPGCTLCHASGADAGSAYTPFGKSMVARGLTAGSASMADGGSQDAGAVDASLIAAINAMRADGVDSDGDGAQDLDELTWGGDPNTLDGLKPNPNQSVNYGCTVSAAPPCRGSVGWLVAGLTLLTLRRVSQRTPKSPA